MAIEKNEGRMSGHWYHLFTKKNDEIFILDTYDFHIFYESPFYNILSWVACNNKIILKKNIIYIYYDK